VARDAYKHAWTLTGRPAPAREEHDAALHEMHAPAERANAVAGDADAVRRHEAQARARQLGNQIAEGDDRKHLSEELETLPL
jgi:hypothetical protein